MIDISRAINATGWMDIDELLWLARTAEKSQRIVEIGSWSGRSACALGENTSGVVFCVDVWEKNLIHDENSPIDGSLDVTLFNEFRRNVAGFPVIPVVLTSTAAAERFAAAGMKFDFIFIDADHTERSVRADIAAWRPLLAEGGVFAGHDYGFNNWPDVKKVVDEVIGDIDVVSTIWIAK